MYRLQSSRFGRALMAIREDEIAANVMGINTLSIKFKPLASALFLRVLAVAYMHT